MAVVQKLLRGASGEFALLRSHPDEHLFGVQLADKRPDCLAEGARLAESRGARFVDLNCGCPINLITGRGMGASLLRKPARLGRLVAAMKAAVKVPVTVKLRTGWHEEKVNVMDVARACEDGGADAITIHGRTREQRYSQAADWDLIGRVATERGVPVIGNGDILTPYEARERMARSGVRSVMIARGALIKPWLFREIKTGRPGFPRPRSASRSSGASWSCCASISERTSAAGSDDALPAVAPRLLLPLRPGSRGAVRRGGARAPAPAVALQPPPPSSPLERVLGATRAETHQRLAEELLASLTCEEACERAQRLALSLPAGGGDADLRVAASEVAG